MEKHTVQIHFATKEKADAFLSYMCGHGEQDYWTWMDTDPDNMVESFDYDFKKMTITDIDLLD